MCVAYTSLYMILGNPNAVADLLNADHVKANRVDSKQLVKFYPSNSESLFTSHKKFSSSYIYKNSKEAESHKHRIFSDNILQCSKSTSVGHLP